MRQFCAQRPFHHRLGQLRQQSFPPQNLLRPVMRRNPSVNQRPLEQRLFFLKSFPVPFPRLCLLRLRFLQVFFVHVLFLLFSLKTRTQTFGYARSGQSGSRRIVPGRAVPLGSLRSPSFHGPARDNSPSPCRRQIELE